MKRPHINLKTKLCSALCELLRYDEDAKQWVKIIPYEEAKRLTEDEILARFDWHHFPIPKAHDGPDTHWNIQPVTKPEHKVITDTIDKPRIAKVKRLRGETCAGPRQKIPQRANAWPKGRKLQSRGFERRPT